MVLNDLTTIPYLHLLTVRLLVVGVCLPLLGFPAIWGPQYSSPPSLGVGLELDRQHCPPPRPASIDLSDSHYWHLDDGRLNGQMAVNVVTIS